MLCINRKVDYPCAVNVLANSVSILNPLKIIYFKIQMLTLKYIKWLEMTIDESDDQTKRILQKFVAKQKNQNKILTYKI